MKHSTLGTLAATCVLLALGGCSGSNWGGAPSYKITVHQGNELNPEAVTSLRLGMSKAEVQMLLGTSLLQDPFHRQRWDYVFLVTRNGSVKKETALSVHFDPDDRLDDVRGDALHEARKVLVERGDVPADAFDHAPVMRGGGGASGFWNFVGGAPAQDAGRGAEVLPDATLPSSKYLKERNLD